MPAGPGTIGVAPGGPRAPLLTDLFETQDGTTFISYFGTLSALQALLSSLPITNAIVSGVPVNAPSAPAILSLAGSATANVSFNLLAAAAGNVYLVRVITKSTGSGQLTCNGTDVINYNGASSVAGGNIKNATGAVGGILFCVATGVWNFVSTGVWTLT